MKEEKTVELSKRGQALLLVGIAVTLLLACWIGTKIFGGASEADLYSNCETQTNPTACPEPEEDQEIIDINKNYPDDSY